MVKQQPSGPGISRRQLAYLLAVLAALSVLGLFLRVVTH